MILAPEIKYRPGAYLIHFLQPIGDPDKPRSYARHYTGASKSVGFRINQHNNNQGFGNLIHVANALGIQWIVAQVVYTTTAKEAFQLEKRWKRNGHHDDRCPICRAAREQTRTRQLPLDLQ